MKYHLFFILTIATTFAYAQNDNPCGAPSLSVGANASSSWITGTNVGATNSYVPLINCDGWSNGDVWYYFNAPSSGSVYIETDYSFGSAVVDLGIAVYRSSTCSTLTTAFSCNDHCFGNSVNPPNWMPCLALPNLTSGEKIYIRLWEFKNNTFGQFKVRVYNNLAASASIAISPNPLSFGSVQVGTSSSKSISITNTGSSPLNITNISSTSGFSIQNSLNVAPNNTQNINVDFAPNNAINYNGTITFYSNATQGTTSISVTGSGTSVPQSTISVSPLQIDFGSISVSSGATTQDLTIQNNGNAVLNISSITIPDPVYSLNWSSGNIAAQSQKTVQVSFNPTLANTYSGFITINSNATNFSNGVVQIPVTGSGLAFQPNSIVGFVKDLGANASGNQLLEKPLLGATVKLKDAGNAVLATTTTNSSGQYTFTGFSGTNYTIEASYGAYSVIKQGFNASNPALTFVIPITINYQINQQMAALNVLSVSLSELQPKYNSTIIGFNTSGAQSALIQSQNFQFTQSIQLKNSIGRLFASQQLLLGYYQNAVTLTDKSSYCLHNATAIIFSLIFTLENTKKVLLKSNNSFMLYLAGTIGNLIQSVEYKLYKFVESGFDYYTTAFPESSAAQTVSELQGIIQTQMLKVSQSSIYVLDPARVVYEQSAKSILKCSFKNPSQSELNKGYYASTDLSQNYFNSLNSVIANSKLLPINDEYLMHQTVLDDMNNYLIASDFLKELNTGLDFASRVADLSKLPNLKALAGILETVSAFFTYTQIELLRECAYEGITTGVNGRRERFKNDNVNQIYFKTNSISPNSGISLNQTITLFNNYAAEIRDNFDYSQDFTGISKIDSLLFLESKVEESLHENMLYIMAAGTQADSAISGYNKIYSTQLLRAINQANTKSMALYSIYLAKIADTTNSAFDQTIVSTTNNLIAAYSNISITISQFTNLLNQFHTPAFPAIKEIQIAKQMYNSSTQNAGLVVKNFGNQIATNCYLLISHDNGFISSKDSVYIGNLNPDEDSTILYQIQAPNMDTIGAYKLDLYSQNSKLFSKGGAISATSIMTGYDKVLTGKVNAFIVYPTPTSDYIEISKLQPIKGDITAKLFDISGKQIYAFELFKVVSENEKINIKELAAGVYMLSIKTEQGIQSFKILKQ